MTAGVYPQNNFQIKLHAGYTQQKYNLSKLKTHAIILLHSTNIYHLHISMPLQLDKSSHLNIMLDILAP